MALQLGVKWYEAIQLQVNLSPDSYLYRMNDVSRELYIVAGGAVELLIEQDDQLDFVESSRSAGQVCYVSAVIA